MKKNKGVLTVEAALMVPLFIFAILFMTQFMKVVFVYDTVQTNIHNTAKFINSYSYLTNKADGVAEDAIKQVQEIFTKVTGNIDESVSSDINGFIQDVLNSGYQSAINKFGTKICEDMMKIDINDNKREWLGIDKFKFENSSFSGKHTEIIVEYNINVSAPFINIDKDIPLKNKVVIRDLSTIKSSS